MAVLKSPNKWKKRNAWSVSYKSTIEKRYSTNAIQKAQLAVNVNRRVTKKKLYVKMFPHSSANSSKPYSDFVGAVFAFSSLKGV